MRMAQVGSAGGSFEFSAGIETVRMKHATPGELDLHIGITGDGEEHFAELFVLLADWSACERCSDHRGKQGSFPILCSS